MSKKIPKTLLFTAVIAIVVLFAATEIRAEFPVEPITDLPRTLELEKKPGYTVTIEAGPDTDVFPGLAAEFPRVVTCLLPDGTSDPSGEQCLQWDYRFTFVGLNPSHSLVSVASDVEIVIAVPDAAVSVPGDGDSMSKVGKDVFEVRMLRYNAQESTLLAFYQTRLGLAPCVATAGVQSGKWMDFGLLAGAGRRVSERNEATSNLVRSQAGPCTVDRTLDVRGRTIGIELVAGNPEICQITDITLTVGDDDVTFINPETQITVGDTTRYCWPNAVGGMTCCGN